MSDAKTRPPKKSKKRAVLSLEPRGRTDLTVRAVVARQVRIPPDDITGDLNLQADLGIRGADGQELLVAMGEALDARFPDDFLDGIRTYADLTAAVRVSLSPL
jgi:acyl carrier protein